MPQVEVDEVELMNLRRLSGVAAKMMQHSEGRKLIEKAQKLVDPNAPTPTLDQEAAAFAPVQKMQEQIDALQKKLDDEKAENEKNTRLSDLARRETEGLSKLKSDGWTQEGIEGVKKLMEDKGILDPLDAAAIFEKQHPQPAPATPSGHGAWGFMDNVQDGEKDLKSLIDSRGESNQLIDRMAREALAEVRGQPPR